ncbi:hypothetical protein OHA37_18490 [Streptomyces sp. NBC_00335]|uniref:hypothetical protein n=1 Tax=unclassified Streptomyces TaxID=2593676 RepID=UPI00225B46B7|nr:MULTISPECIES: hypothetical protein [unclassified Streptomyces]MCX5405871.1 hypothetical protein [Streptomyces sp. NBC_00086]
MKDFDLEEELAAAMLDRAGQEPPRGYDVDGLIGRVRLRRRRLQTGAVAAAVIVALGAGFVVREGRDRTSTPAPAATAPSPDMPPAPSVPVEPPPFDLSRSMNTLFLSALRYQNPATRSQVDPAEVAALFSNEPNYRRIWGADSLGVTCGTAVDGVLLSGGVLLYRGTEPLDRIPSVTFDATTGKVVELTCATNSAGGKGGDPTVSGFYGGLVTAAKSGDSTAPATLGKQFVTGHLRSAQGPTAGTCSVTTPPFWLADNPSSGTLTHGWTVNLGGASAFPIDIDENAKIAKSCGG